MFKLLKRERRDSLFPFGRGAGGVWWCVRGVGRGDSAGGGRAVYGYRLGSGGAKNKKKKNNKNPNTKKIKQKTNINKKKQEKKKRKKQKQPQKPTKTQKTDRI